MARSWEELYAEIARLPPADRLRLLGRLLVDAAVEMDGAALPPSAGVEEGAEAAARAPRKKGVDAPPATGATKGAPPLPSRDSGGREPDRSAGGQRAPKHAVKPGSYRPPAATTLTRPRIVLDGSNFLGAVPGFDLTSADSRERLILRLQEYAHAHPGTRVTIYFDGQKPSTTVRGGVDVRFSGSAPADQFILAYLRGIPVSERGDCTLVTDDRELASGARSLGVAVEAPRRFQHRIPAPPAAPADRGLSPSEVAEWEEYFRRPKPERP